ncbi:cholinesterase-like [Panonychus citri]|uniref:cholinesterase-like n=1 Tax=Panonychus citri TaxID=50023 RepID=UPI0023077348|nr:cholinesterase-like [Panonychus citri]
MYQLLCYIYPLIICGWDPPQVTTKWSRLEGIKEEFSGKRINTFLGIPYAEPPVGDLRFRPPVALSSTNFLQYYAGNYRSSCLDRHYHEKSKGSRFIDESEDCLFLNIWSPEDQQQSTSESSKTSPKLSSVLLYLNHISTDIRQINGKVLASLGDVTVVTFNYRTGLFGLIQNGDKDSLENAIYHDTKAVLDWIKENIQLFGGNPESITVIAEGWEAIKTGLALEGKYFDKLIITNGPLNSDEDDSHIDLDSTRKIRITSFICIANSSSSNSLVIRDRHVAKWTLRHLSECPLFRLMENLSLGNNAIYSLLVDSTAHGFKSRPSLFRQVDLYSYRAFDILTGAPLLNTKLLHKEVQRLSRELIKIIGHFIRKGKAPWPKLSHSESGSVDIKKSYQYRISSEECSSNLDLAMKSQFCSILQKL